MTVEELEEMINDLRWEHFESEMWGQIQISKIIFAMRVGLHMDRPTQAVMAEGQFVRMRSADYWKDFMLTKLDPDRLYESLYFLRGGQSVNSAMDTLWRPKELMPTQAGMGGLNPGIYGGAAQMTAAQLLQIQQTLQLQSKTVSAMGPKRPVQSSSWTGKNTP